MKPDNFLIGQNNRAMVYIIDFGLAKRYINPKTGKHIPYRNGKSLTGTARYASISTHMGIEQSRRDDLEGAAYMLIYLLRGNLPWQGLIYKDKEDKHQKIMQCKTGTSLENLCKGLPTDFQVFLRYTKTLKFDEDPDYNYLRGLLKGLIDSTQIEDGIFDWSVIDTSVDKNKTFMHLVANQNKLAGRYSDLDLPSPKENEVQTYGCRRISVDEFKTPKSRNDTLIAKVSPKLKNIGTTNDMFVK